MQTIASAAIPALHSGHRRADATPLSCAPGIGRIPISSNRSSIDDELPLGVEPDCVSGRLAGVVRTVSRDFFWTRGIFNGFLQPGHFTVLPASEALAETTCPHAHFTAILAGVLACASPVDGTFVLAGVLASGITTGWLQAGHFTFLPAYFSAAPNCFPHEHLTRIGID
jgi:hypothetical protein